MNVTGSQGLDTRDGIERVSHHVDLDKDFYDMEPEIQRETFLEDIDGILVFTNLPKVKGERYQMLFRAVRKKLAERDVVWDEDIEDFLMPVGDEPQEISENNPPKGKTHGLAFVEFKNSEKANRILNELNGVKFDKNRNWSIQRWKDWLDSENIEEEFVPPSFEDFQSSEPVRQWLEDEEGRDQFLVRWLDRDVHKTALYWGDHRRGGMDLVTDFGPTIARIGKQVFCVRQAEFSPLGSYILTRHDVGLKIWSQGRDNFWNEHCKLAHSGVSLWEWSPQENFLVTFNADDEGDREDEEVIFWSLETGQQMRRFHPGYARHVDLYWPYFRFSADDAYFGWLQSSMYKSDPENCTKAHADKITLFQTSDFRKIAKRSLQTTGRGIRRLEFNPCRNFLAYVTTNKDCVDVTIITVPGRDIVGRHSYSQPIKGIQLIWHPNGNYLCVKVTKLKKKRKGKKDDIRIDSYDLTIFNCNYESKVGTMPKFPNTSLGKAGVLDIKWEPTAPRMCVLQRKESTGGTRIRLFDISSRVKERFEQGACPNWSYDLNQIHWSPTGRHLVLSNSNDRIFFDADYEKYVHQVHSSAEDLQWDPSGRFVISIVATDMDDDEKDEYGATDNAWVMYNFQGDVIAQQQYKGFQSKDNSCLYSFQWRPRPKSLLSDDEKLKIKRNLKQDHWVEFEKADIRIRTERSSAEVKERLLKQEDWQDIFAALQERGQFFQDRRRELRGGIDSEDEDEFEIEETTEEEVIRKEDVEVTIEEIQMFNG